MSWSAVNTLAEEALKADRLARHHQDVATQARERFRSALRAQIAAERRDTVPGDTVRTDGAGKPLPCVSAETLACMAGRPFP